MRRTIKRLRAQIAKLSASASSPLSPSSSGGLQGEGIDACLRLEIFHDGIDCHVLIAALGLAMHFTLISDSQSLPVIVSHCLHAFLHLCLSSLLPSRILSARAAPRSRARPFAHAGGRRPLSHRTRTRRRRTAASARAASGTVGVPFVSFDTPIIANVYRCESNPCHPTESRMLSDARAIIAAQYANISNRFTIFYTQAHNQFFWVEFQRCICLVSRSM
jgi:hypothetical protein